MPPTKPQRRPSGIDPKELTSLPGTTKYGCGPFNAPVIYHAWELMAFAAGKTVADGGLGRFQHFRNASKLLFPNVEWNPWAERQIRSLCDDYYAVKIGKSTKRYVDWAGCAAAGKTFNAGHFALIWWLADSQNSIVIFTSTTGKMVRKRVWPVIQQLYFQAKQACAELYNVPISRVEFGNLVDSKTTLQARKGDDKHAIFAIAVKDGNTASAAADIQGMHAPRILVVVDEATDTPEAIYSACWNLEKGCQDFTLLSLANPKSRLDQFGLSMEPKNGWSSVSVNDDEWETKRGICLHFDGHRSPNVNLGYTRYKYIYTNEDYLSALRKHGTNTLEAWQYDRGFPAPDSVDNTVFSEVMVMDHRGMEHFTFYQRFDLFASLDPAFGGDACKLLFAKVGDVEEGNKMAVDIVETIEIHTDATIPESVDKQIAKRVIEECQKRGVKPEHFGSDATGTGRGVFAYLYDNWSTAIHRVEFGGAPSELRSATDDQRPSNEIYDRRVTELWFACRDFLKGGQLRGLYRDAVLQFCGRTYTTKGRKYSLEKKEETKARIGRSPDDADAIAVLIDTVRKSGIQAGSKVRSNSPNQWLQAARELHKVYETDPEV